ncbi:hypothetical protein MAXJ12_07322 [Mesorhizobium alhagi CCNWXJ12-2]|jgi:hypothetical protein|uniref:Uncharacterized protein n=1 Tax=Mesorhizobium alhagi CCNWXJ12-2 TaxID=1107882 RepID=H0HMV0_9HYPH|nr:hypothetical protein MAXJ12_07322 [Mesorhizobium alhagi CCNWXJ12-2]
MDKCDVRLFAPSPMLRMVPLPRKRGRISGDAGSSPAKRGRGTAEGGGGGEVHPPVLMEACHG